jgi:hypothetical protein
MKSLLILLLVFAAAPLTWVALRAEAPNHIAHKLEGEGDPVHIPAVLLGEVPSGTYLYEFVVDGPCCNGCSHRLHGTAIKVAGIEAAAIHFDGDENLAYGQVWIHEGQDPAVLLSALTFERYTAHERDFD